MIIDKEERRKYDAAKHKPFPVILLKFHAIAQKYFSALIVLYKRVIDCPDLYLETKKTGIHLLKMKKH